MQGSYVFQNILQFSDEFVFFVNKVTYYTKPRKKLDGSS
jgi:hypothetical protein